MSAHIQELITTNNSAVEFIQFRFGTEARPSGQGAESSSFEAELQTPKTWS